jgi:hypothetical protein
VRHDSEFVAGENGGALGAKFEVGGVFLVFIGRIIRKERMINKSYVHKDDLIKQREASIWAAPGGRSCKRRSEATPSPFLVHQMIPLTISSLAYSLRSMNIATFALLAPF